jgi:HAE1 family hydrophobic/amphiphilic exporter-1
MELQDRAGLGLGNLQLFADDLVAEGAKSPQLSRLNQNFSASVPQLYVDVDRERVKTYGVPLQSVFTTLQANLGSMYVNDFNLFGRTWRVMVQADEDYRTDRQDITALEVRGPTGAMIPVGTLATVRDTTGPSVITRFNMFRSATVTGSGAPGVSSGQATDALEAAAANVLPEGMGYEWSGVTYQQKAAGNLAPIIFSLAILFVYLFLAAQYESWSIPFSVLLTVPMAVLGAAVFTLVARMDNNIYTQIGLVLLIGLSAKSAILIVEFAKQLREEGKSVVDAAHEAARLRFRPILMTAFSFILGVIPLAIATGAGGASRRSLGTAVLGGMIFATVLGLIFTPYLYALVQRIVEGKKGEAAEAEPATAE